MTTNTAPTGSPSAAPEYLFLAPIRSLVEKGNFVGKPGPEMIEADGNVVWDEALGRQVYAGTGSYNEVAMDFHTTTYAGQPVLVWWQGYITINGYGTGVWKVVNDHYQTIATVRAPRGYETDFHTFEIAPNGMAYFLGTKVVNHDLSCCGGSTDGTLYDQVIFETNLKTGQEVWSWDPLQHIPLSESYLSVPHSKPWDPYHVNSIAIGSTGNLVISARNTWAAYWISRSGANVGAVTATLGGKKSTFKLGSGVHFAWQHDVSLLSPQEISVFADEANPPEAEQSRGEVVSLDWSNHTASLVHQYFLPHPALAGSQGSVQTLANGNVFVGWGQLPYFSEYTPSGQLLYLGRLNGADESYRSYRAPWVGIPLTKPAVALEKPSGSSSEVLASWNGATQVTSWQLLAGPSASALAASGAPTAKHGFQTTISTSNPGPCYAVEALGSGGEHLGTSETVSSKTLSATLILHVFKVGPKAQGGREAVEHQPLLISRLGPNGEALNVLETPEDTLHVQPGNYEVALASHGARIGPSTQVSVQACQVLEETRELTAE